jgi:hypothetical protein
LGRRTNIAKHPVDSVPGTTPIGIAVSKQRGDS